MKGFHLLVTLTIGGGGIKDTQCGFKLFSRYARKASLWFPTLWGLEARWCCFSCRCLMLMLFFVAAPGVSLETVFHLRSRIVPVVLVLVSTLPGMRRR